MGVRSGGGGGGLLLSPCMTLISVLSRLSAVAAGSGGGDRSSPDIRHHNTRPQSSAAGTVMTAGNTVSPSPRVLLPSLLQQTDLSQQHCGSRTLHHLSPLLPPASLSPVLTGVFFLILSFYIFPNSWLILKVKDSRGECG